MRPILSASNLGAAALCPGKPNAERGLKESESAVSARGTDLHRYFRSKLDRSALSMDDRSLLEDADGHAERFTEQFRQHVGLAEDEIGYEERELSLDGPVPGHPDVVTTYRLGAIVQITDLKTGMGDVTHASENYQLSVYASLVFLRKPFEICGVAIVQPDALGPRMTTAIYTAEQMPGVIAEIERIKAASEAPDAPRIPGEYQCQWCRFRPACPEFTRELVPATIEPTLAVATLTNEQIDILKQFGTRWDKIKEELNTELKRRIEAGEIEGWKLRSGGADRQVSDSIALFETLQEHVGITATEMESCFEMGWTKLKKLVAEKKGLAEKKADELIKDLAAPYVVETPRSPSAIRVKAK
jgi:hypothetical protein